MAKRNSAPGCGIDGTEGENFTSRATSPWDSNPKGNFMSPKGRGPYQNKGSGLRNKMPDENTRDEDPLSGARDIFDSVENQSSDSGNRAVKSGKVD